MTDIDRQAVSRIVAAARGAGASTDEVPAPGSAEPLQEAVRDAGPDDRSAAAKELAGEHDRAALDALHQTLKSLGIQPE